MVAFRKSFAATLAVAMFAIGSDERPVVGPGSRVVVDAHNCYPYNGRFGDRIDRALSVGLPVAIEQDLFWYTEKRTGRSWSIDSHGKPVNGAEPRMRDYFFERIHPIMEQALRDGNRGDWPLITLNLDFRSDEAEHHKAVWELLARLYPSRCIASRMTEAGKQ